MKKQIIFKKGQKVMIKDRYNASDFNIRETWSIMSAYSIKGWEDKIFEIEGTVKLITFDHNPRIYGAYLLTLRGVKVGYIYNVGIRPY